MRTARVALLLCLAGCGRGPTTPPDAGEDATLPFDWTVDALPPRVTGCGDGRVERGESCDDANDVEDDGCSACRFTALCGDGVVSGTESCDDGNATNGDGCRASCSEEICGDGFVDAPGEACEQGDVGCVSCSRGPACGDGIVDQAERCDDTNTLDWDGCSSACDPEQVFVVSELGFETDQAFGCDVTGTGTRQNALGRAFAVLAPAWNAYIASQFRDVTRRPAIGISGFVRGAPPPRFRVAVFDTELIDPVARSVVRTALPFDYVHAHVDGLEIVSDVADIRLDTAGAVVVREALRRAALRLSASPDISSATRLDGVLCGVVGVAGLADTLDPLGLAASDGPACAPLSRPMSLADLIAGGRILGFIATPVDVDLDGDGLEELIIAGVPGDGCTPVIVGCVEGDGTRIDDPSCVSDFDDGWSTSLSLLADRASFAGVD